MTTLDTDGRRLLEHYQDLEGTAALQPVGDATGTDPTGDLTLVVDAARRVRRVTLAQQHRLRTPDALVAALVGAYTAADSARGAASLEASGSAQDWVRWAEELRSGQHPLDRGRPPGVRRADVRPGSASYSRPQRSTGRSDNGYLAVSRDERGDLVAVAVDAEWLGGASHHHLERALQQAFDHMTTDTDEPTGLGTERGNPA